MGLRAPCLLIVCGLGLAACGPTNGPSAVAVQHPIVTTTPPLGAPPGPTQAESGPSPPAFDRYGNANYDSSGTYTGGHGVGTLVDNPDRRSWAFRRPICPTCRRCTARDRPAQMLAR